MSEQRVELLMDEDHPHVVYARRGYTTGKGKTVEEALTDLRSQLSPESKRARAEKAWGTKEEVP